MNRKLVKIGTEVIEILNKAHLDRQESRKLSFLLLSFFCKNSEASPEEFLEYMLATGEHYEKLDHIKMFQRPKK